MGEDETIEPMLVEAVRAALVPLARARRLVSYRELADLARVPPPHKIHKVTLALEALMRADHAAGRPLLASVAVSRVAPGTPGRGYFQLLVALGRYQGPDQGPEAAAAHARELEALWAQDGVAAPKSP